LVRKTVKSERKLFMRQGWLNFLVFTVIISSLTYLTYERNKVWMNDVTLWKDSVEKAPDNARAYNNLGRAYGALGRDREAIEAFKKALEILPNYALAHMNMAVSYGKLGMNAESEFEYREAMRFYPGMPDTYYNYGFFLYSYGRYEEARQILNRYIALEPTGPFVPFAYKLLSDMEKKNHGK